MKEVKSFECDFCGTILLEKYMVQHEQFCYKNPNSPICRKCNLLKGRPFAFYCKPFPDLRSGYKFAASHHKACPYWESKNQITKVTEI